MPRAKKYNEEEVLEKAMTLFWKNGYENTSTRMLEKEMGINQFSIYSSFGNKEGVFRQSLKLYKAKMNYVFEKLINSNNGIDDIKDFFYDSIEFSNLEGHVNGCLLTNTYNEFAKKEGDSIKEQMDTFMCGVKDVFIDKLKINSSKDEEAIVKQANYLLLAKHGLAAAARVNTKEEIKDYIETVFENI